MLTSPPGRLSIWSDVPWGRPDLPGYYGSGQRAPSVEQLPQATGTRFGGPVVSTSSHGRHVIGSDVPCGRPDLPGY